MRQLYGQPDYLIENIEIPRQEFLYRHPSGSDHK